MELDDAVRELWASIARGDAADRFASGGQLVGTDPADWYVDGDAAREHVAEVMASTGGFGVRSHDLRAVARGDVGWFADRITVELPELGAFDARATGVLVREGAAAWRVAQLHLSFGVPDDELEA